MKETDLAYIAAYVDAEGSIGIYGIKSNSTNYAGRNSSIRLTIVNSDKETLEWIKKTINEGGSLKTKKRIPERKQIYDLCYDSLRCSAFLQLILPYMREKKRQAEIAIQYQARKKPGNKGLGPEEWAFRDRLQEEIKRLKHGEKT